VRWRVSRGVARGDGVVLRLVLLCRAVARNGVAMVVRRATRGVARGDGVSVLSVGIVRCIARGDGACVARGDGAQCCAW
jgi:hypothetical protein